jgi:excisionase family DNA binding protein
VGINSAIRTVEEFLNDAKQALSTDRRASPSVRAHPHAGSVQLDSETRRYVAQEVRTAVSDALAPVLKDVKANGPSDLTYLSVEKAAAVAEVHPDTIRAWVKAGRLPEHRAGRELRIRRDELHRFLDRASDGDVRPTAEDEAAMILSRKRR